MEYASYLKILSGICGCLASVVLFTLFNLRKTQNMFSQWLTVSLGLMIVLYVILPKINFAQLDANIILVVYVAISLLLSLDYRQRKTP